MAVIWMERQTEPQTRTHHTWEDTHRRSTRPYMLEVCSSSSTHRLGLCTCKPRCCLPSKSNIPFHSFLFVCVWEFALQIRRKGISKRKPLNPSIRIPRTEGNRTFHIFKRPYHYTCDGLNTPCLLHL